MKTRASVVIVGGGVMGCSIAYHLSSKGVKDIVLVERDSIGSGSTGRSSGLIRMHYSTEINTRLAWESFDVLRNFDEIVGGNGGWVKTGFMIMVGPDEIQGLKKNIMLHQSVGVDTSIISVAEAKEIAPGFDYSGVGAIGYEPESGYGDPSGVTLGYATRAREMGVAILLENPLVEINFTGHRIRGVQTKQGFINTDTVVLATGPWSGQILNELNIDLPLVPTRHSVILLQRPDNILVGHPAGCDTEHLVYFRPEGGSYWLVGNGNHEEIVNPNAYKSQPEMDYVQDVWDRMTKRIPNLANAKYFTGYSGLYTSTPDDHPIVDTCSQVEGLYICSGFSGHGYKESPAIGRIMSELILTGKVETPDITPLKSDRFSTGETNQLSYKFKVLA
jgi:sarcosine oxidase subunit beta